MSRSRRAVRWLQPGLVVKRWVLTSGLGLLIALLGAAVWADLQPIYWGLAGIQWLLKNLTTVLPREVTGPLVLAIGGLLIWLGQSRSFGTIQQALAPDKDTLLVDALAAQGRLNRGPSIVAIGGGTGLATLLSGLKRHSSNLTAIVTVADDGGSSGVLRRELGVQPPGTSAIAWRPSPGRSPCSPACSNTAFRLALAWRATALATCSSPPSPPSPAAWRPPSPPVAGCWRCRVRWCRPPMRTCGSGLSWRTVNASRGVAHWPCPQSDRAAGLYAGAAPGPAAGH